MQKFWVFLRTRWYNFCDFCRVVFRYYIRSPKFALIDLCLLLSYFYKSPYRLSREFEEKQQKEITPPYGETPLATMDTIAKVFDITPGSTVYELGAGRGRTCFWLACFTKAKIVGIEYHPEFMHRAQKLKKLFRLKNPEFICADMLKTDLTQADYLYLYGTALEDHEIKQFIQNIKGLRKGAKIVTISFALSDYEKEPTFELIKSFNVPFCWGTTTAYLQEKK